MQALEVHFENECKYMNSEHEGIAGRLPVLEGSTIMIFSSKYSKLKQDNPFITETW